MCFFNFYNGDDRLDEDVHDGTNNKNWQWEWRLHGYNDGTDHDQGDYDVMRAQDRSWYIAGGEESGNFGSVTIIFTWPPLRLCNILMISAHWQLIGSQVDLNFKQAMRYRN